LQIKFKNEQINQYAAELEQLVATKNKFFSIIAHDLRNPFVGIENFTRILLKLGNYDVKDIEQQLETIHSTAVQGHELLENLLRWAKSQTGALEIDLEVFQVQEAVQNCYNLIHTHAENKNIQLVCRVSEDLLIESDQYVLETILRNLLSNAVKFTPMNGTVTTNAIIDGDCIEFSISDTGIGMSEEITDKLFRIDKKLQSQEGTNGESGSGLGLILCKEFKSSSNLNLHLFDSQLSLFLLLSSPFILNAIRRRPAP
jgi:signal transduction histidine kinase